MQQSLGAEKLHIPVQHVITLHSKCVENDSTMSLSTTTPFHGIFFRPIGITALEGESTEVSGQFAHLLFSLLGMFDDASGQVSWNNTPFSTAKSTSETLRHHDVDGSGQLYSSASAVEARFMN